MKFIRDFCEVYEGLLCSLGGIFLKFTTDFREVHEGSL